MGILPTRRARETANMGAQRRKINQEKVEAAKPLSQQAKKEYDVEAMQVKAAVKVLQYRGQTGQLSEAWQNFLILAGFLLCGVLTLHLYNQHNKALAELDDVLAIISAGCAASFSFGGFKFKTPLVACS